MKQGTCTGCKRPILWFKTIKRKNMPADPDSEMRLMLNEDGEAVMVRTYTPHWGTCPEAEKFKKDK